MFELEKSEGVIYQDVMKTVCGGPLFPLPCGPASLIPLGLIFLRIGKMFFLLQVCFWIKAALGHVFLSPLRPHAWHGFPLLWFCFLPKSNTGKRCSCGCCFLGVKEHWTRCETERISGWGGEKFAGWKKIKTCSWEYWEFRATDVNVRRFGHMRVRDVEGVRVWGWKHLRRCEEDKI